MTRFARGNGYWCYAQGEEPEFRTACGLSRETLTAPGEPQSCQASTVWSLGGIIPDIPIVVSFNAPGFKTNPTLHWWPWSDMFLSVRGLGHFVFPRLMPGRGLSLHMPYNNSSGRRGLFGAFSGTRLSVCMVDPGYVPLEQRRASALHCAHLPHCKNSNVLLANSPGVSGCRRHSRRNLERRSAIVRLTCPSTWCFV